MDYSAVERARERLESAAKERTEQAQIDACREFLGSGKVVLPVDVVIADEVSASAPSRIVPTDAIPDGWKGLDIGPASAAAFGQVLTGAETVFWNGPMGVFELAPFAEGTRRVAETILASGAFSVVGGGSSAAVVRAFGLPAEGSLAGPSIGAEGSLAGPSIGTGGFSHISTGGGASLEFLEGEALPGIAVLEEGVTPAAARRAGSPTNGTFGQHV